MIGRLAWLLSGPGRIKSDALGLPIIAFGVVTTLVLVVLGGARPFWTWKDDAAMAYQFLAVVALSLLLVPLATLGGAAARLTARRRDDRLATLRLLGASRATVSALTVIEASGLAAVGASAGALCYLAAVPLLGVIRFRGAPLGAAGVLLNWWEIVGTIAGVIAVAALSAVLGLRRVVISPLGVRTRDRAARIHWIRFVFGAAAIAYAVSLVSGVDNVETAAALVMILVVAFGGTMATVNVVGPWIIGVIASRQVRLAKTSGRLIAARLVLESPKAAWRQLSGVAMTSFVAVFAGTGSVVRNVPGIYYPNEEMAVADVRTGIAFTVLGSFLMVACAVAVNQSAAILDRAELYRSLDMVGMPLKEMDAARRRAVLSPLLTVVVTSGGCAVLVLFPLVGLERILDPASLAVTFAILAGGIGVVQCGLLATRRRLASAVLGQHGRLPPASPRRDWPRAR